MLGESVVKLSQAIGKVVEAIRLDHAALRTTIGNGATPWYEVLPSYLALGVTIAFAIFAYKTWQAAKDANTLTLKAIARASRDNKAAIELAKEQAKKQDTLRLRDRIREQMSEIFQHNKKLRLMCKSKISGGYGTFQINSGGYNELVEQVDIIIDTLRINPLFVASLRLLTLYYEIWGWNLKRGYDYSVTIITSKRQATRSRESALLSSFHQFCQHLEGDLLAIVEYSIDEFQLRQHLEREYYRSIKLDDRYELNILTEAMDNLILLKPYRKMKEDYPTPYCQRKHLYQPEKHMR